MGLFDKLKEKYNNYQEEQEEIALAVKEERKKQAIQTAVYKEKHLGAIARSNIKKGSVSKPYNISKNVDKMLGGL